LLIWICLWLLQSFGVEETAYNYTESSKMLLVEAEIRMNRTQTGNTCLKLTDFIIFVHLISKSENTSKTDSLYLNPLQTEHGLWSQINFYLYKYAL